MNFSIDFYFLIANSLVTLFCGGMILYLIYIKKLKKHLFYYFFSVGFIIYGIEIFGKALSLIYFPVYPLLWMTSYLLFSMGLWYLDKKKIFFWILSASIVVSVLMLLYCYTNMIVSDIAINLGLSLPFFPLVVLMIHHRNIFGKTADRFTFGWIALLLTNVILFKMGWIADAFAIFSKLVILMGIIDYEFVILTKKIRDEMTPHPMPMETGYGEEGGIHLVLPSPLSSSLDYTEWVYTRFQENLKKGVKTYLFVFQDVISHSQLRGIKWINPEMISIFLYSTSAEKAKKEFTVLPMGITEIGSTLSEVIREHLKAEKSCTVIFMDLSVLIHLCGIHPVYRMLLDKLGGIREAGVNLFAFFHPYTHGDKSVVSLFINLADEVIKL